MNLSSARWTQKGIRLLITCCGQTFEHPANRWRPRCPRCGATSHLDDLRRRYRETHEQKIIEKEDE